MTSRSGRINRHGLAAIVGAVAVVSVSSLPEPDASAASRAPSVVVSPTPSTTPSLASPAPSGAAAPPSATATPSAPDAPAASTWLSGAAEGTVRLAAEGGRVVAVRPAGKGSELLELRAGQEPRRLLRFAGAVAPVSIGTSASNELAAVVSPCASPRNPPRPTTCTLVKVPLDGGPVDPLGGTRGALLGDLSRGRWAAAWRSRATGVDVKLGPVPSPGRRSTPLPVSGLFAASQAPEGYPVSTRTIDGLSLSGSTIAATLHFGYPCCGDGGGSKLLRSVGGRPWVELARSSYGGASGIPRVFRAPTVTASGIRALFDGGDNEPSYVASWSVPGRPTRKRPVDASIVSDAAFLGDRLLTAPGVNAGCVDERGGTEGCAVGSVPLATAARAAAQSAAASPSRTGSWSAAVARPLPPALRADSIDLIPAGRRAVLAQIRLSPNLAFAYAPVTSSGEIGTVQRPARAPVSWPAFDARGRGIIAVALPKHGIGWATIDPSGRIGPSHRLGARLDSAQVAVNARGDLVIAWLDENTPSIDPATYGERRRLRVAIRPAGGTFRRTETLPLLPTWGRDDTVEFPYRVAVGPTGLVVAAVGEQPTSTPNRVVAWTGTVHRGLGPRQRVGLAAVETSFSVAFTARGGAVLAWSTQSVNQGTPHSPLKVRAVATRPGGTRFGPTKELDPGGPVQVVFESGVHLLPRQDGGALLVWQNRRTEQAQDISTATVDASGHFTTRRRLATDVEGFETAAGPAGAGAITWNEANGASRGVYRDSIGDEFGAPEPVPTGLGDLLFWPSTGRLTLVGTPGPAKAGESQSLLFATRGRR